MSNQIQAPVVCANKSDKSNIFKSYIIDNALIVRVVSLQLDQLTSSMHAGHFTQAKLYADQMVHFNRACKQMDDRTRSRQQIKTGHQGLSGTK